VRLTRTIADCYVFAIMLKPITSASDIDCRVVLTCFCGAWTRVSSPLGAFMSGWRRIQWDERHAQCWLCEREQRVREMRES
jgi:hypothetical protein